MVAASVSQVIDATWPALRRARNMAWVWLALTLGVVLAISWFVQRSGGQFILPFFIGLIVLGFVAIIVRASISNAADPITRKLIEIAGFKHGDLMYDVGPLRAVGLLPSAETTLVGDHVTTQLGDYTLDRLEVAAFETDYRGKMKYTNYVFVGIVIILKGLPAQHPSTCLRRSDHISFQRTYDALKQPTQAMMPHESDVADTPLGDLVTFHAATPATAQEVETLLKIHAASDHVTEKCFGAHFGPDFCAVSIASNASRMGVGGFKTTKADVTRQVDKALARLSRSFTYAGILIAYATDQRTDP